MVICNGKEAVGNSWQCPQDEGEELDRCYSYDLLKPPFLPYCQPLA